MSEASACAVGLAQAVEGDVRQIMSTCKPA